MGGQWAILRFETWQLVVNTATTIVTLLMVFVLQHTQNRDGEDLTGQELHNLRRMIAERVDSDAGPIEQIDREAGEPAR